METESTISVHFTHDCTLVLNAQLIQTGSVLLLLPLFTVLGFTLYKDTGERRAVTHQLYSSAIEVWYAPMLGTIALFTKFPSVSSQQLGGTAGPSGPEAIPYCIY